MATVGVIEGVLRLDDAQFNRTIDRAIQKTGELLKSPRALAAAAGIALAGAAKQMGEFAGNLAEAGLGVDALTRRLDAAFDGTGLESVVATVRELGSTGDFDTSQFERAAKQLERFRQEGEKVEEDLVRIGNLAQKTGGPFETLGTAVATFGFKKEASNQLLEIANISPKRLEDFGAVLDATEKGLDLTGDNALKARAALRKLLDTDFAGAMDEAVQSTDQLRGELKLLSEDAGAGLAQLTEAAAEYILPYVQALRDLPGPAKAALGITVALGAAVAAAGAATIAFGLALGPLTAALTAAGGASGLLLQGSLALALPLKGLGLTVGGLIGTLGASVLAIGAVTIAMVKLTKEYETQAKAADDLLKIELRRNKGQRELAGLLGKNADELAKEGKTAADATDGILALQERIQLAQAAGNTALVEDLKKRVVELRNARAQLAGAERAERIRAEEEAAANTPKAKAAREKLRREEDEARKTALAAELDGIELRLAKEEISQREALKLRAEALDQFKADESEKRKLLIETAKFEVDASKKAAEQAKDEAEGKRAGRVQAELDRIDNLAAARKIDAQEELRLLKNVLNTFELSEQEKRSLARATASLEGQLAQEATAKKKAELDKQTKDAEKAAKDQEALAKQTAGIIQRELDEAGSIRSSDLSSEIQRLQAETAKSGADNTAKIKAALREQLDIQVDQIRAEEEREKAATESAEARALIEGNAQARIQAAIRETAETEKAAVEEQIEAIKRLQNAREPESGLGKDPFGIEDFADRLREQQATTRRRTLPSLSATQLNTISAQPVVLPQAQVNTAAVASQQAPTKVEGSIRVQINVDAKGRPTLEVQEEGTNLDGRFSAISSTANGMIGEIRFG